MARLLGPKCRHSRRIGEKLFLKGERCSGVKCAFVRRNYPPGQHGQNFHGRLSEYGTQLKEKQKVRKMYGLMEREFRHLYRRASKMQGDVSANMISSLERRLDNVIYRLGFATSRVQARQFVRHGHVRVNGKRVSIASRMVNVNDLITIESTASQSSNVFQEIRKRIKQQELPMWLARESEKFEGKVVSAPSVDEFKQTLNLPLIVEYYSR